MGVNARAMYGLAHRPVHARPTTAPPVLRADRPAADIHNVHSLVHHPREEMRRRVEPQGGLGVDAGEPDALYGRRYFGKGCNLSFILCW